MERHIIDKPHDYDSGDRLKQFIGIARREARSEHENPWFQKAHAPRTGKVVEEYLRIERGQTA
jgi:hypothetical protein